MFGEFQKKIEIKLLEPAVYAVVLRTFGQGGKLSERFWTSMMVSYTVDEAIKIARRGAVEANPDTDPGNWLLFNYSILLLGTIDKQITEWNLLIHNEVIDESMLSEKNILMKKIINSKDRALLEKYRDELTEADIKYIENFL